MKKNTIKEAIQILQDSEDEKSIQVFLDGKWQVKYRNVQFNFIDFLYRTKPEPEVYYIAEFNDGSNTAPTSSLSEMRSHLGKYSEIAKIFKCVEVLDNE
jgi:hypothetical protein